MNRASLTYGMISDSLINMPLWLQKDKRKIGDETKNLK